MEEVLETLRGAHAPPAPSGGAAHGGFAWEPLAVFACLVAALVALRWWRRTRWRRMARARLAEIDRAPPGAGRWGMTVALIEALAAGGVAGRIPDAAHAPPERARPEDLAALRRYLGELLRVRAQ